MKKFTKKALSLVLALVLATSLFATAFAADPVKGITAFAPEFDSQDNLISFTFVVEGFTTYHANSFNCVIRDKELGSGIFTQAGATIVCEETSPLVFTVDVSYPSYNAPKLNPDEDYIFYVGHGSFSDADGYNDELTFEIGSDGPSGGNFWDKLLVFLHGNAFFEFIFALLIAIIEYAQANPIVI